MTNPTTELERVLELVEKATPGPWLRVGRGISAHHHANNPRLEYWVVDKANGDMRREAKQYRPTDNAAAIAAAVNFIREHGHTLLEAMRDAERLDYIERTYSGVTSQERYLPVKMIWGKGCNGRTLREACDKYMARDAAKESTNG